MPAESPLTWYMEMPPVSKIYLTGSFLTTAACALDFISPFTLYYNYDLIFRKGECWRLVSNFLFFGLFSLDFLFHMYFLVRYCRLLEEGEFRGRPWDFALMLTFGAAVMLAVAPFLSIHFLGSSLTFMMVYVWGRRNEHVRMSFLGLFPFNAPYLPWVMLAFSVLLGNPATTDMIGIAVGHIYFFGQYVYPAVADIREWPVRRLFAVPSWISSTLGILGRFFTGRSHQQFPSSDDDLVPDSTPDVSTTVARPPDAPPRPPRPDNEPAAFVDHQQ